MYCKFYHIFFFRRSQSLFPSVLISCFWYVCAKVFFLLRRVLVFFCSQWASKLYHCKRTRNWTKKTFMEFHRLKFIYVFWEGQKICKISTIDPWFVLCSASQIYDGDFAKLFGLLRIYELYKIMPERDIINKYGHAKILGQTSIWRLLPLNNLI